MKLYLVKPDYQKICVIGTGYVGLVTGTCFAEVGHHVECIDKDTDKIGKLCCGQVPIYEPGLEELILRNVDKGSLSFGTDIEEAVNSNDIIYIAVGTPEAEDGSADLTGVYKVAEVIGRTMKKYKIIVIKSTVPVGTAKVVKQIIKSQQNKNIPFAIVSNPEFLREGSALSDIFHMERAVIGSDDNYAAEVVKKLYQNFTANILLTNSETAEMIKYASNAFLATKITFINQIANICEKTGADVMNVAEGMGMDRRIGRYFLRPGVGYGGSCFPKDTKALVKIAKDKGYNFRLLQEVIDANEEQKTVVIKKVQNIFPSVCGRKIAVLGLTFKPDTDDIRSAPSHNVVSSLLEKGAEVKAYDPNAARIEKECFQGALILTDLYQAVTDCDCAIILTEWNHIKEMDLKRVKRLMRFPFIIDGRNIFLPSELKKEGFWYDSIGRSSVPDVVNYPFHNREITESTY